MFLREVQWDQMACGGRMCFVTILYRFDMSEAPLYIKLFIKNYPELPAYGMQRLNHIRGKNLTVSYRHCVIQVGKKC